MAAALRLNPGTAINLEGVHDFCRERLARFKIPKHIRIVDAFPLTASGKVQKYRLRQSHEAELKATAEA